MTGTNTKLLGCTASESFISPPEEQHCRLGMLVFEDNLLMTVAICQYILHGTYGHMSARAAHLHSHNHHSRLCMMSCSHTNSLAAILITHFKPSNPAGYTCTFVRHLSWLGHQGRDVYSTGVLPSTVGSHICADFLDEQLNCSICTCHDGSRAT